MHQGGKTLKRNHLQKSTGRKFIRKLVLCSLEQFSLSYFQYKNVLFLLLTDVLKYPLNYSSYTVMKDGEVTWGLQNLISIDQVWAAWLSTAVRQVISLHKLAPPEALAFDREEVVLHPSGHVSQPPMPEHLLLSTGQHPARDLKIRPANGLLLTIHLIYWTETK